MNFLSRFALATTLLATASPVLAGTGPWTVSEAAGKVTVTDVSGTKPVARGMVIPAGATLTTGPGGRAVMVRGPEFVTVSANSRLRVAEAAQQTGLVQILQDWGNAMFRIDKQKNPHFAVKTPYLAAVVKGTTFSITVSREGASMQVVEGAVEVSTGDGGARDLIRPGSVALVAAGDRYRLTVQGQDAHVVDSPIRSTAPAGEAPVATPNVEPSSDLLAADTASTNVIAEAIQPKAIELSSITGGLVSGNAAFTLASAVVSPATNAVVASESPLQFAANFAEAPVAPVETTQPFAADAANATTTIAAAPTAPAQDSAQFVAGQARPDVAGEPVSVMPALPKETGTAGTDVKPVDQPVKGTVSAEGDTKAASDQVKDQAKAADDAAKDAAKAAEELARAQAKAADDAAREAKKAADDAAKVNADKAAADAAKAADDAAKAQAKAADDAAKAAAKAADDAAKDAKKAADDAAKGNAGKSPEDAAKEAAKAADDAAKAAAKAADDAAKDAKKAADDAAKNKAAEDAAKEAAKAADDAAKAAAKAADDAAKDAAKAAEDAAKNAAKAAEDAAKAAEDAARDAEKAAKDARDKENKGPGGDA